MSLIQKTLLIVGSVLISILVIFYFLVSAVVSNNFSELEKEAVRENVQRVLDAFADDIGKLNFTAKDWSNWDDTYAYVKDHNESYFTANLNENSIAIIKLNIIEYVDSSGRVVFGTEMDLETKKKIPVPESFAQFLSLHPELTKHTDVNSAIAGVAVLPEGPLLIASRPILTSQSEGPIRGTLIFGRYYDQHLLKVLSERTRFKIEMRIYRDPKLPNAFQKARTLLSNENPTVIEILEPNLIAGYTVIKDIFGAPALLMRVDQDRDIYHQGQMSLRYLLFCFLAIGVIFLGVIFVLINRLILVRLSQFEAALRKIRGNHDLSARISADGQDELARLGQTINSMLGEIEKSRADRIKVDEQLQQTQKIDAVGALAGGVAHDFNNLLTAIICHSDFLLKNLPGDSPLRKEASGIYKAGEKAATLTQQLMALGRKQVLETEVLNLNSLISNTESILRQIAGKNIELVIILEKDLAPVKTDLLQIEQVIINLVTNARDAMPAGGRLIIETANVALDEAYVLQNVSLPVGRYVMLAVSDTGSGISKENLTHLFEPFFTTKGGDKGKGLGLSAAYGIVKQSGGDIHVYSEPDVGSTFKIYLPRAGEQMEIEKPVHVPSQPARSHETILLVEDEAVVRRLAYEILKREGYTVLEASCGEEALQISEKHKDPIHLLLTDVVMPKMSGPELSEKLGLLRPEMKVVLMSGYTDKNIVSDDPKKRKINFVQKPFTPVILTRKLREVLDLARNGMGEMIG